ncbi:Segment polarity protein dishevelled -like protein DVL-3 [Halotydeus destructor]|nr:Segment polarity protein dishevelled -like protein DVL-3 [Halotydeus destructor]
MEIAQPPLPETTASPLNLPNHGHYGVGNIDLQPKETKIVYYVDDEDVPYSIKVNMPPDSITLRDLKQVLSLPKTNYKFFFKALDEDFGVLKEEIADDEAKLPVFKGKGKESIVAYIVSAEGSNVSSGSRSQITEVSGVPHNHHRGEDHGIYYSTMSDTFDSTTCTETESFVSSRRMPRYRNGHSNRRHHCEYESSSVMTSEVDSTCYSDSEEDDDDDAQTISRVSTTTDETSVSRIHANRNRRRRLRHRMPAMSRMSSDSSVTSSSMSLNIITVVLNMDTVNFLGISIVGQSNQSGDGGIYVGSIMKGGAVALDGKIEPGDLILQVNDVNFENMTNDEAVHVLRDEVNKRGPIKLVVAKCWDPKGYFALQKTEPVRPIDPGAWVAHTEAARATDYMVRPVSALTSASSSIGSSTRPETERSFDSTPISLEMDMLTITNLMAARDSGLPVRDRTWLKIPIPNAFLGSDAVDWLYTHVQGFADRRQAKKYASEMLKQNFIKTAMNKSFKEQCYYVFGDFIGFAPARHIPELRKSPSSEDNDVWNVLAAALPSAEGHHDEDLLVIETPDDHGTV